MHGNGNGNGTQLPRPLPLVGRRDELQRLFRVFGAGSEGGALRVLVGEGGVGKSRLAQTLAEEASRRDWRVVHGRAYPVEQGVPYAVMADAFVPLLRELDASTLTVLSRGREADLRRLFPALGVEAESDRGGLDPDELRTRLFWSFGTLLQRLGEREPILVVLEDLHWADSSSVSLLHFLVRHLEGDGVRIVASSTAEDRPRNPRLLEMERSLESLDRLERLDLQPFGLAEIETLLNLVFRVSGPAVSEFADRLFGWTRGNAYFVEQTLRSLVESGRLHRRDGTWMGWEARDLALPSTIRDAVAARFGDVSEAALDTAHVMAALGRPARLDILREVTGVDRDGLASVVEELVASGAVEEIEREGRVLLQFLHPLTRETLYRGMALTRQRLLHGRIVTALETVYGSDAAEHADELAFHLSRTPGMGDPRMVRYLEVAGQGALGRHANGEAADYLDAALRSAESMEAALDDPEAVHRIRRALTRAQTRMGRYEDARRNWERLLLHAEESGDAAARANALRHLGLISTWQGRHAEGLEHLAAARSAVPPGASALGARIELAAGITLQQLGRAQESRDRILAALKLAQEVGDDSLLAWVHRALALINTFSGNTQYAREHARHALELGRATNDARVVFWGEWVLASLEGLTQGPRPMEPWLAAARDSAKRLGSPVLDLHVDEMELEYLYFTGDWDAALRLGARAIDLARSLNQRALLVRLLVWTSSVYVGRGDLDRAAELVEEATDVAGIRGASAPHSADIHAAVPALIGQTTLRMAQGRLEEAVESGHAGLALAEASGYVIWALHRLLPVVGEAYVRLDDVVRAEQVMDRFTEEGRKMDHRLSLVWAKAAHALVTRHSGELVEATRLLGEAADAMEAIGIPYEAARIRRQYAGRLAELHRDEEAAEQLARVHQEFERLGAEPELRATLGMFDENDIVRPRRQGARTGGVVLSPREWEIAELVAQRKSNKEIARILGISYRTVTTHCQNIYQKVPMDGDTSRKRVQLGDKVREGRLGPAG